MGGSWDGRRAAGDALKADVRGSQRSGFLTASPQHEGIPPYQPDDSMATAGFGDQPRVDLVLWLGVMTARLADENSPRARRHQLQQPFVDEPGVDDHVGAAGQTSAPGGEKGGGP